MWHMRGLSKVCICGAIQVLRMENIVVVVVAFVVVGRPVPPFDSGVTGRRHVPMTDYSTFTVLQADLGLHWSQRIWDGRL
jgi:hypothetical protein